MNGSREEELARLAEAESEKRERQWHASELPSQAHFIRAFKCWKRAERFRKCGRDLLAEPQMVSCISWLQSALWESADNYRAHFLLIAVYMKEGRYVSASEEIKHLMKRLHVTSNSPYSSWDSKGDPLLHSAIGHASRRMGHEDTAKAYLVEACLKFPEHPKPCLQLGEAMLANRCYSHSEYMARLALERDALSTCKQHLVAAEHERAAVCFILAVSASGISMEDAVNKLRDVHMKKTPIDLERLLKRSGVLRERLKQLGENTDFPQDENAIQEVKPPSTHKLSSPTARHVEEDDTLPACGVPAMQKQQNASATNHDPVLNGLQRTANAPPQWRYVSHDRVLSDPHRPVPQATMHDFELMMGLMPGKPAREDSHRSGPAIEDPVADLGCCIATCRQQCRRL
jgi:hypothetical protein